MNILIKILNRKYKQYLAFWVAVLLLLASGNLHAQKGFSLTTGVGKYDLANVGVQWNCSNISSFSAFAGSNFGLNNNTAWAAGLSFNQVFRKPANWKVKPGYSLGTILWTHNDDLYFFKTMSFPILALLEYPLTSNLKIRVEGGIVFSTVMQSDRKQNVTAGYPKRFDGDIGVKIIYKFKRDEAKKQ